MRQHRRHAEDDIARARRLQPDDARIIGIHGQVLTILGRTRQARAVHAEALLAPMLKHVHGSDARAHLAGGRLGEAAGALTRALAAGPQDDTSRRRIADLVLSACRRLMLVGWLAVAAVAGLVLVLAGPSVAGRAGVALGALTLGAVVAYLPWREAGTGVRSVAAAQVPRDPFLALSATLALLPFPVALGLLCVPRAGARFAVQLVVVVAVVLNVLHPFLVSRWQSARDD